MADDADEQLTRREMWQEVSRLGALPARGMTGSIANHFRAATVRAMTNMLWVRFKGDGRAFVAAMRTERETREGAAIRDRRDVLAGTTRGRRN